MGDAQIGSFELNLREPKNCFKSGTDGSIELKFGLLTVEINLGEAIISRYLIAYGQNQYFQHLPQCPVKVRIFH